MADTQFDVSKKIQRLFCEKQKKRLAVREAFLKRATNPYEQGKQVVDQAVIRYHAMIAYQATHLHPNVKNSAPFFLLVVVPIFLLGWHMNRLEKEMEHEYRSGLIAPKDRFNKMLC